MKTLSLTVVCAILLLAGSPRATSQAPPASPFTGGWEGFIKVAGTTLAIRVTFARAGGGLRGTIDIPQQGAAALVLDPIEVSDQKIRFELRAGTTAVFDGVLDAGSITGTFAQGSATGTFLLARPAAIPLASRSEELIVGNGNISLAGTLSLPSGPGPFPAAILITGSGAQDRDEEVAGFKVFAALAGALVSRGIAVFRYDDRGVGRSNGNIATATTDDFSGDAFAIFTRLKTRPELDPRRIGFIGHSEGATVATIAASRSRDIAFIVLLAPPGLRGDELLRQQVADAARTTGADGDAVIKIVAAHRKLTEAALAGKASDELAGAVKDLIGAQYDGMPPARQATLGNRANFVEMSYRPAAIQVASPWMKFMLAFDPVTPLRQVTCPVLALFGSLDAQVPPTQSEPRVRSALAANRAATTRVLPGANHLFQSARTGLVAEYAELDKAFMAGFTEDISAWIAKVPQR